MPPSRTCSSSTRRSIPALGATGVTAFIVERDTPGLTIGRKLDKMGLRTSPMAEVIFDDCASRSTTGSAARAAASRCSSARWSGSAAASWRAASASCGGSSKPASRTRATRKQFGKPIGKFQSVANRIVDMKVRLDTCRPLVYRIGWLKDQNRKAMLRGGDRQAVCVGVPRASRSLDAMQIFGGYGYMTEQEIERDLRDAVGSTLYSGTSEIQRNIIATGTGPVDVSDRCRRTCRYAGGPRPQLVAASASRPRRSIRDRHGATDVGRFAACMAQLGVCCWPCSACFDLEEPAFLHPGGADCARLRHPLLAAVRVEGDVLDRAVAGGRVRAARRR